MYLSRQISMGSVSRPLRLSAAFEPV